MYYQRQITNKLKQTLNTFPVITLLGARQCGKTTLLRKEFPAYRYVSLETPDIREMAINDPKHFIELYPDKTIIDEVQRVPSLLSYLQEHIDLQSKVGMYILTGSHNFMLSESISQSLAGRTAVFVLAPLSIAEMRNANLLSDSVNDTFFRGAYPRVYQMAQDPTLFYSSYLSTYIERDVKLIKNITNISTFEKFLHLLAARCASLLNTSELSTECGVARQTIESWISILEQSYIVFRLQPFSKNTAKRYVKSAKLYFYDTGLVSYLLGINRVYDIENFYMKGALFENLVVSDCVKNNLFTSQNSRLSFYRDSNGIEVDIVEEKSGEVWLYEIKSSSTMSENYWKAINKVSLLLDVKKENTIVIYRGESSPSSPTHGAYVCYKELWK